MYHGNTKITALIFLAIISTVIALIFIQQHYQTIIVDIPKFNHQQNIETRQIQSSSSPNTLYTIPATLMLPVPFTPQAPTANWDAPHNEACEEASAIMAAAYFAGSTDVNLKPDYVESEIAKLTKWQEDN